MMMGGHGVRTFSSSSGSMSFIEKARVMGANALLGRFTSAGKFDSKLDSLTITRIEGGEVEAEMPVSASVCNAMNNLHGGCTCLLVDVMGTLALMSTDPLKPGVSVEINSSFTRGAPLGSTIKLLGKTLKRGKRLGFTQVDIIDKDSGNLVASGRHTKAF